jgi:hypothetical protein
MLLLLLLLVAEVSVASSGHFPLPRDTTLLRCPSPSEVTLPCHQLDTVAYVLPLPARTDCSSGGCQNRNSCALGGGGGQFRMQGDGMGRACLGWRQWRAGARQAREGRSSFGSAWERKRVTLFAKEGDRSDSEVAHDAASEHQHILRVSSSGVGGWGL